jgi:RNA recognition motif-containing protein
LKILIRNLSRDITQPELMALFAEHGRVQSCTIVMDAVTGGSKGFGFANMPVPHEAKAAIRALNNHELKGSRMRVKKAEASQSGADAAPAEESVVPETAVPETTGRPAGPRIKKNGIPLGPRKSRVFRKKS